jgi:bidirectional [NiFe] hydrogenase diaphorase subunit
VRHQGPRDAWADWQRRRGRVRPVGLEPLRGGVPAARLAAAEGLPVAAVHGALTFFADLVAERAAPGGEPTVPPRLRVCAGTACRVSSHQLPDPRPAGAAARDVYCLGYCYAAPAALVGDAPAAGSDLAGQLAGRSARHDPPIPVSVAARQPVVLAGVVGGDPPWRVWPAVLADGGGARVLAEVAAARLRGRGGAGFPAARKWAAVAAAADTTRYVVANGDEGDPGSFADRLLLEADPGRVLEGLALAGLACGAGHGVVYVRSEYPRARRRVQAAVAEAYEAGHLGADVHGRGVSFDVTVVEGAGSYVSGEETALLHALAGLRGAVRPRPPYPTESGLFGRPTAVNNVETLAAVPWILGHGGAAYAEHGTAEETGTELVSLSERFARPGVYEVELGVPLRVVVEELGGGLRDSRRLAAVQIGGPLGGFLGPDRLDLPLLDGALTAAGAALGHAGIVAVDDTVPVEALTEQLWRFGAEESCGSCLPCRIGTRQGLDLAVAGRPAPAGLLDTMAAGSLCAFGRRLPVAVRSLRAAYGPEPACG